MEGRTVEQLFSDDGVRYRVPIYQRHYVWGTNNWNHLWTDIREKINDKGGKEHFTGIIVIREEQETKVIVDGQQRLTTFQIILCAIRDICIDTGNVAISDSADKFIRDKRGEEFNPVEQYKLLPTAKSDLDAFQPIAAGNAASSSGRIHEAYTHFKNAIKEYVAEDTNNMSKLYRTFLRQFLVIQLELDPDYEAAKIFESLNGRGRTLIEFDHLRNNMFLTARENSNSFYNTYWFHFNNNDYWFSDKVLDPFLTNFLKAKLGGKFDNSLSLFDLYQQEYRKEIGTNNDSKLVVHEFKELQQYSLAHAEIANCNSENPLWFYKYLATRGKITSWHPLILLLKSEQDDLSLSDDDLKLIFRILESYIVRCMLCHGLEFISAENRLISVIRSHDTVSVNLVVDYLKTLQGSRQWPTDPDVRSALSDAGEISERPRWLIHYILFQIERELTDPNSTETQLNFDFKKPLNIEHVMPRKWYSAVDEESGAKLWPLPESDPDKRANERHQAVQSLGNLTLLTKKTNDEAKNSSFSTKMELYTEHSRLSLTRDIIWTHNAHGARVERTDWDVEEIKCRERKLVELFFKIWPFV